MMGNFKTYEEWLVATGATWWTDFTTTGVWTAWTGVWTAWTGLWTACTSECKTGEECTTTPGAALEKAIIDANTTNLNILKLFWFFFKLGWRNDFVLITVKWDITLFRFMHPFYMLNQDEANAIFCLVLSRVYLSVVYAKYVAGCILLILAKCPWF